MVSLTYAQQIQLLTCKLAPLKRKVVDVAAKGNCLFDAVRLQYNLLSDQPERAFMASTQSLRDMIATWVRTNKDWLVTFSPDLSSPQTLDAYCRRITTDEGRILHDQDHPQLVIGYINTLHYTGTTLLEDARAPLGTASPQPASPGVQPADVGWGGADRTNGLRPAACDCPAAADGSGRPGGHVLRMQTGYRGDRLHRL